METTLMCFLYYLFIAICYSFGNSVHAIESPKYIVIQTESDFEIRLYNESSWISAPSSGTNSFQQSTKTGFHRFYFYIYFSFWLVIYEDYIRSFFKHHCIAITWHLYYGLTAYIVAILSS
jgi:hypothetical protein